VIHFDSFQPFIGETPLLAPLNFRIKKGEFCVLTGASGAGKTRLLETIANSRLSHGGAVTLDARVITSTQSLALCPSLDAVATVSASQLENLSVLSTLFGFSAEIRGAALKHLQSLGFAADPTQAVGLLSGGERQRIALARVMNSSRKIWLLDEPVSQLDAESSFLVLSRLKSAAQERGAAVLCVLHQQQLAEAIADSRLHWSGQKWIVNGGVS
jgi:phosphonate transport system ATP-binding protein